MISDVYPVPAEGEFDFAEAERASLAGFHLDAAAGSRPPWFVVRSWHGELRLYQHLARHLGPDQPIVTIAPPRGTAPEDFPRTVETWRDFCLEQAGAHLDASPFLCVGGWSFGGVLALEMARRLEEEGRKVERVAMLDTRVPRPHSKERRLNVAEHLARLRKTHSSERAAYLRTRIAWQAHHARQRVGNWMAARRGRPAPIYKSPDGSKAVAGREKSPLQKALWVAYLKYRTQPCTIPVSVFWCSESCEHVADSSLGWSHSLRGPFEAIPVPGQHMTLFKEPHVAELSAALRPRLDAALGPRTLGKMQNELARRTSDQ